MDKSIRLLVEGFFDDEIFNVEDDINSDIEDIGNQYYNYKVGEMLYQCKKPYAICCGEPKYFNDNKPRFCLLKDSDKRLLWRVKVKLVKDLKCFEFNYFNLTSFNDFKHIDENGYKNTKIIKNYYNISEFPAFKYCIELGDNVYLPAIDELLIMYLNKNKLDKYSLTNYYYCSSTLYSVASIFYISTFSILVDHSNKKYIYNVRPFFYLD